MTAAAFAMNMGGSGLAPAFSSALGARLVSRRLAPVLFGVFVCLGAMLLGSQVARTLGKDLVAVEHLNQTAALVVVTSAAASLLLANVLGVPQSTSWVTVASISTVGLLHSSLNTETLFHRLIPAWLLLPCAAFLLTRVSLSLFYPLRPDNFRRIEWLTRRQRALKGFVLASSCLVAFSIGSNNVANVVAPIAAAGILDPILGFALSAPLFGLGAALLTRPSRTVGTAIVPLGPIAATIVNLVTGLLLLTASVFGIPQSLVQIMTASVIAVRWVKDGPEAVANHAPLRKVLLLWIISPLIAALITWLLLPVAAGLMDGGTGHGP